MSKFTWVGKIRVLPAELAEQRRRDIYDYDDEGLAEVIFGSDGNHGNTEIPQDLTMICKTRQTAARRTPSKSRTRLSITNTNKAHSNPISRLPGGWDFSRCDGADYGRAADAGKEMRKKSPAHIIRTAHLPI